MHQAFGTDYQTVAACTLKFSRLLDKTHGRLHETTNLIGNKYVVAAALIGIYHQCDYDKVKCGMPKGN